MVTINLRITEAGVKWNPFIKEYEPSDGLTSKLKRLAENIANDENGWNIC